MISRSRLLDRLLRPFSKVQPGEGLVAALLLVAIFLILSAYYVMKTAREGLILAGGTFGLAGDELKTYATGAMALLLVGVVPAYGALANRVRRIRLINVCYAIVVASLALFFVLARAGVPIGLPFFIWLGLVSVFLIAQFWSYANDLYTEEQGKRLFAIIATGGSLGAIFGPKIAKLADTFSLLGIAAALLLASITLFNVIDRVNARTGDHRTHEPITGAGGFALVLRDRYLLLIGLLLLVLNLVNTTGEYVLSNAVRQHANELAATAEERREIIKAFYSDFFFWVNATSFIAQAFLVSRVIDKLGVRRALFVMPLIAFGAYTMIGAFGGLALVRAAKVAENATDYSLQNTVRQALFLPTDRVVKYKAKAAIDTFFVRTGDTLSAVLIGVGIHQLGLTGRDLAFANLILITVWLAIAGGIARRHRSISNEGIKPGTPPRSSQLRPAAAMIVLLAATSAWAGEASTEPSTDEPTAADVARAPLPGNESGRLDKPEGDSTLRDIGQGVLLVPRVAVEATMAPVRAGVWAFDRYQLVDRFQRVFFDEREIYGLYPTLRLDTTYGLTVGARFVHRDVFGAREHVALRAATGGEYRQQFSGDFRTGERFGKHIRLELGGDFERQPKEAYYGIGNDADGVEGRHRQELERASTTLDFRVVDSVHLRAAGAVTDLEYAPSEYSPSIDMTYEPTMLTGWFGARNLYGELELRLDTRRRASPLDQPSVYGTGWLVAPFVGRVHQLEAGADYWRYGGDAQYFWRLGAGPRAIASRLHVEAVTGTTQDVAFTQLPQLGGKYLLRGYPRDRFRDRTAIVGSLEYEWDLGKFLMASLFVDGGRVFDSLRELEPLGLRMGYGMSLQLHARRKFIGALTIASSIDGGIFVDLTFDPVFDTEPRVEQR